MSTSVLKAAILLDVTSNSIVRVVDVIGSGVDTDLLPHKETVRDVIANISVVNERVVLGASLLLSPHVLGIACHLNCVCVVGGSSLDRGTELLIEKQLSIVSD